MSYEQRIDDSFDTDLSVAETCEIGREADREIAAKDQRVKELEEALGLVLYSLGALSGGKKELDGHGLTEEQMEFILEAARNRG